MRLSDHTIGNLLSALCRDDVEDAGNARAAAATLGFTTSDVDRLRHGGGVSGFGERVRRNIATGHADRLADIHGILPGIAGHVPDPQWAALLDAHGLTFEDQAMLSHWGGTTVTWETGEGRHLVCYVDPEDLGSTAAIDLAPGVQWVLMRPGAITITIPDRLPETVKAVHNGRPLAGLLRHPVLDAFDMPILDLRDDPKGTTIVLREQQGETN